MVPWVVPLITTVTPGMGSPLLSVTVPEMVPDCANMPDVMVKSIRHRLTIFFIELSFSFNNNSLAYDRSFVHPVAFCTLQREWCNLTVCTFQYFKDTCPV